MQLPPTSPVTHWWPSTEGSGFGHDASTRNRGAFFVVRLAFASCDIDTHEAAAHSTASTTPADSFAALIWTPSSRTGGQRPEGSLRTPGLRTRRTEVRAPKVKARIKSRVRDFSPYVPGPFALRWTEDQVRPRRVFRPLFCSGHAATNLKHCRPLTARASATPPASPPATTRSSASRCTDAAS